MRKSTATATCLGAVLVMASAAWSQQTPLPAGSESESPSFGIARRGTATVEDAYRLFLTLSADQGRVDLRKDSAELSFEEVTVQLEALCIIDSNWSYSPQTCLRRDVLAYMCCSYLGCRPGIVTGMFGMTRRYAHREMQYRKIIAPGPPATLVSGSELLSVSTRVSRRIEPRRDVQLRDDQIH